MRQVIADYGRALENKDLALFRAIKPNLAGPEEKLQDSFANIKSRRVGISVDAVQVDGDQATVRVGASGHGQRQAGEPSGRCSASTKGGRLDDTGDRAVPVTDKAVEQAAAPRAAPEHGATEVSAEGDRTRHLTGTR